MGNYSVAPHSRQPSFGRSVGACLSRGWALTSARRSAPLANAYCRCPSELLGGHLSECERPITAPPSKACRLRTPARRATHLSPFIEAKAGFSRRYTPRAPIIARMILLRALLACALLTTSLPAQQAQQSFHVQSLRPRTLVRDRTIASANEHLPHSKLPTSAIVHTESAH